MGWKIMTKSRIKYLYNEAEIRTKSKSATNSESVGYKIAYEKVLN